MGTPTNQYSIYFNSTLMLFLNDFDSPSLQLITAVCVRVCLETEATLAVT